MSKQGYIQRYLLIIRLIRNNRYISLPELIRKVEDGLAYYEDTEDVGISRRTILLISKGYWNSTTLLHLSMPGKNCLQSSFRKGGSPVVQNTCPR